MANIGISKASYYADTSLIRFTNEGVKSVDRLSSAQTDVVNGDIATMSGMNNSFKLAYASAKASVVSLGSSQAYLTTALTALDNASNTLAKIQELAVLGANGANSDADHAAVNAKAEELADQFHNVMADSKYKNGDVFDEKRLSASMLSGTGGKINLGLAKIDYDFFYDYKNPEISILNGGLEYEITQDLSAEEKAAILSRTTGLSEDDLVVGFRFTTDVTPSDNVGEGRVSFMDGRAAIDSPYDTLTYDFDSGVVPFDTGAEVESEAEFAGGFVEIEVVENGESGDNLSLRNSANIFIDDATGIVSYLDPDDGLIEIGEVKEAQNGEAGKVLRISLFGDSTKPQGSIPNGDFELVPGVEYTRPTELTKYGVEKVGVVTDFSYVGGADYVSAGDAATINASLGTNTYNDSDTYNISLTGGTGTGFRASVVLTGGVVSDVDVLDYGEGYQVGDLLTFDPTEFSGSGAGFALTIETVATSLEDRIVLDTTPNDYRAVENVSIHSNVENDAGYGDARYPWGQVYNNGDIILEEVLPGSDGSSTVVQRHLNGDDSPYDWTFSDGTQIEWKEDGKNKYSLGGNDFTGEYARGDIIKLFSETDQAGYSAVLEKHTDGGADSPYDWTHTGGALDGQAVEWIDVATGNENYVRNGAVWDGSYGDGDIKLEYSATSTANSTAVYEAHTAGGTYSAADEGWTDVTWTTGGQANYMTADNTAWSGDYVVGEAKLIQLAVEDYEVGASAVYVRNTNAVAGERYDWGAEKIVGGRHKVEVGPGQGGNLTNYIHEGDGAYNDWGVDWQYAPGGEYQYKIKDGANYVDFTGTYATDDIVLVKSDEMAGDIAIYETWDTDGFYESGDAYFVGDIKLNETDTGVVNFVNERQVKVYEYEAQVAFYANRKTLYTKDDLAFYTKEKDPAFYAKQVEAFYVKDATTTVAEVSAGAPIQLYNGESETPGVNDDLITGYEQDDYNFIQNWYVSELNEDGMPRIFFGEGNSAGSFQIKDTNNGNAIQSSIALEDGGFYDDSAVRTIDVPTPSWEIMRTFNEGAGSPEYDYVSYPTDEGVFAGAQDQDDGGLIQGLPSDGDGDVIGGLFYDNPYSVDEFGNERNTYSVDIVPGRTGNAVELNTGQVYFDNDNAFGIYHGPAIVSDEFEAFDGQILRLEYTASGDNDDYHVAGYIYEVDGNGDAVIDPATGLPKFTMALMETGTQKTNGRASVNVELDTGPGSSANFRFVFIVGTHDKTGGQESGASMTIDNIVVEWPAEIDDEVMQALLQAVHYENDSDTATPTKTLKATVSNEDGSTVLSDTAVIEMEGFTITGDGGPFMLVPEENLATTPQQGLTDSGANGLTAKIENLQKQIDNLRTLASSKIGAVNSAIDSATDLRSQFALASGTLSDINFSVETVHAAKRQMQQNVASAMMAQANQSQSGILSLVQDADQAI